MNSNIAPIFDDAENEIIDQTGVTRGHRDNIWVNKVPGRAIRFRAKGKDAHVHIFAAESRVYKLTVISASDDEAAKFLGSLDLQPQRASK